VLSRDASELRHIGVDSFMMLLLVNSRRSCRSKANLMPLFKCRIVQVFCADDEMLGQSYPFSE
jgi:hypothetical protein